MEPSLRKKKKLYLYFMTRVNAELVFNAVTKNLRNIREAFNKTESPEKPEKVPPLISKYLYSVQPLDFDVLVLVKACPSIMQV